MVLNVVMGVLVLGILVFVHELGHFIVAKRNHIIVDEFGFGFPPRLLKLGERDGTEYTINAIPFGGFVRMRGEDDPSEPGSFAAAPKRARAATLLAGAGMNFLVAILLFYIVLGAVMDELSMLLLTIPIFFPMVMALDFGMPKESVAIWFGILVLMTVSFGLLSPPVGLNVFVVNGMAKTVPLGETFRGVMPFLASDAVRLTLLIAFPPISLWLLRYIG